MTGVPPVHAGPMGQVQSLITAWLLQAAGPWLVGDFAAVAYPGKRPSRRRSKAENASGSGGSMTGARCQVTFERLAQHSQQQ